jgi:cation diffusion facilitator family transporter
MKILAGLFSNSGAIIADGIHSLSDVLTTLVAYIGVRISIKQADESHPYGHEKFEPIASKILAIILMLTAAGIVYSGYQNLVSGDIEITSNLAMYAAAVSIVVKEWMYRYTMRIAVEIKSNAYKADAWHHRTDAFSSIGALIGIGGARFGYLFLEPIATILIGILIIKVALDIYISSINELTDRAAADEVIEQIRDITNNVKGMERIDLLRTRQHATRVYVDIEIAVDGDLSLYEAHEIAQKVHDGIETEMEVVKHCMVHVNPK